MIRTLLAASVAALGACATPPVRNAQIEGAVRWGVEACELHLLEGVAFEEALATSARGRAFVRDRRTVEHWWSTAEPYRLEGLSVYVGADAGDTGRSCDVMAAGAGSAELRRAIIAEHLARTDRTWTDRTPDVRGTQGVCTMDRVPEGQSVLLTGALIRAPFAHMPK